MKSPSFFAWLDLLILIGVSHAVIAAEAPVAALPKLPQADRPLAARFMDPPASSRILKIIHKQPDDPAAQDRMLQSLTNQGFGGFVSNVAFDGYLEDETKWPAFLRGVRKAKDAGMSLWLYDERGYPSGTAGDLTLRGHPEWAARGLLVAEASSSGGEVALDLPPGKLVIATALPMRSGKVVLEEAQDLSKSVSTGKLRWQAPPGDWRVFAMTDDLIYENTHAAMSLAMKNPCTNLLMPEPTARFLEVTHDRYAARLGNNLGQWFVSTFTDEPSLMSYWFKTSPYRVLPWSAGLAAEFQKRRGCPLRPLLPGLVADAGPRGAKARSDFWLTIGELVSENYFGQIQAWCHKRGVASGGHLLMEENLTAHVPLYGDFLRCARRLDAPGIDCLTSLPGEVPWRIARLLGSVADLEERRVTMCETSDHSQRYRRPGDDRPVRQVTEDEIRGTCNRLLFGGMNTITSYYSFTGLDDEALRRLNLHVGRCSTMLAGGHQVADIAVLYPIESVWPEFIPAHQGSTDSPGARRIEQSFRAVTDALYGTNRDFTFVDSRALAEAKSEHGFLVHGKLRWQVVVLPQTSTLPLAAWENLQRFCHEGGVVIAAGALPCNSEAEFPSARVQALAGELFGNAEELRIVPNHASGAGVFLPTTMTPLLPVVLDRLIERDVRLDDPSFPLRATHRRVDDHDVYFVLNDSAQAFHGAIHLRGKSSGELWDPRTGSMSPLATGESIPLQLSPYGAMLFRFPASDVPKRLRGTNSALPSLRCESLPQTGPPHVGKAGTVEATLTGDSSTGWRAAATLTKGDVDTHLFLSFEFPDGLDLAASDGVALETSIPESQQTSGEILIMLREKNGADYITGTGRLLSGPFKPVRSQLLFSQFNLAGWSKDSNGRLDPKEITAIRIGWGGHIGTEGEKIEFQTSSPQRFELR